MTRPRPRPRLLRAGPGEGRTSDSSPGFTSGSTSAAAASVHLAHLEQAQRLRRIVLKLDHLLVRVVLHLDRDRERPFALVAVQLQLADREAVVHRTRLRARLEPA